MPFVQGTCPNCGGILAVDKEKDAWVCPFCETPFIVEKAVNIYNTTNNIKADTVNIIGSAEKSFEIIGGVLKSYRGEEIEVIIPDNVREIGTKAFFKMTQITKVVISDSVKKISEHAFCSCYSLEDVTFSKGLTEIGRYAFLGCSSLKNITLPEGISKIENGAFSSCKSLKNVVLPSSLKMLDGYVFDSCEALEALVIPDNVQFVNEGLCRGCSNLEYVKIGENTHIDFFWNTKPFSDCPKLLNIDYKHLDANISAFPAYEEDQMYRQRMNSGLCYYCGGKFTGLFNKKCSGCGKPKSY